MMPRHGKKERYLDAPYEKRDPLWNAWLDEEWSDGNPYHPYRERVHRVFKAMCGPGWEQVLRSTPVVNVCPFRTVQTGHLPPALWSGSGPPWHRPESVGLFPDPEPAPSAPSGR